MSSLRKERERERELLCGRVRRPRLRISCSQLAPSPHFPSPFRPLFIPICRLLSQGSILRSYPLLLYLGVVAVDSPLARRGRTTAPSFYSSRCESSRAIQLPARLLIHRGSSWERTLSKNCSRIKGRKLFCLENEGEKRRRKKKKVLDGWTIFFLGGAYN